MNPTLRSEPPSRVVNFGHTALWCSQERTMPNTGMPGFSTKPLSEHNLESSCRAREVRDIHSEVTSHSAIRLLISSHDRAELSVRRGFYARMLCGPAPIPVTGL